MSADATATDIDAAVIAAHGAWGSDVTLAPAPEGGWRCFCSVVHFTVGDTPTAAILAVPAALAKSAARAAAMAGGDDDGTAQ